MKVVTKEEIERCRTAAGGWTRKQLEEWGVGWPPKKGWKKALQLGIDPDTVTEEMLSMRKLYEEKSRNPQ